MEGIGKEWQSSQPIENNSLQTDGMRMKTEAWNSGRIFFPQCSSFGL